MIIMNKRHLQIFLLLSFLSLFSVPSISQEVEMISPYVTLQYFKNNAGQKILQTTLTYSKNRMELPLAGMEVSFYKGAVNKELISAITTDDKGIARLELGNDIKIAEESDGKWAFSSEFKGNDTIAASVSELSIKDVNLEMTLSEIDSIKTVAVSAFISEKGGNKPVSEELVKIYVPTMFAPLLIGEITLDESGAGTIEFPNDLPGDSTGNLTIISKFEESENFGNVEKLTYIKWGTPKGSPGSTTHRALWTKTAPKWMIYTLSVLLAGVWGHYLFAIISLIRIKIDARRQAEKEYKV
jgi:hypothetical protein